MYYVYTTTTSSSSATIDVVTNLIKTNSVSVEISGTVEANFGLIQTHYVQADYQPGVPALSQKRFEVLC